MTNPTDQSKTTTDKIKIVANCVMAAVCIAGVPFILYMVIVASAWEIFGIELPGASL